MTPTHLAAYIARGPAGLPAFDLPAVLDALLAEWATTIRAAESEAAALADDLPYAVRSARLWPHLAAADNLASALMRITDYTEPCQKTRREDVKARAATIAALAERIKPPTEKTTETP